MESVKLTNNFSGFSRILRVQRWFGQTYRGSRLQGADFSLRRRILLSLYDIFVLIIGLIIPFLRLSETNIYKKVHGKNVVKLLIYASGVAFSAIFIIIKIILLINGPQLLKHISKLPSGKI